MLNSVKDRFCEIILLVRQTAESVERVRADLDTISLVLSKIARNTHYTRESVKDFHTAWHNSLVREETAVLKGAGQMAYEVWAKTSPYGYGDTWESIGPSTRETWEAIARAARRGEE